MPDVQEVFRMATQKVGPDPGALERQNRNQRRRNNRQRAGGYALLAVLVIAALVIGFLALRPREQRPAGQRQKDSPAVPSSSHPFFLDLETQGTDGTIHAGETVALPESIRGGYSYSASPDGTRLAYAPSAGGGCVEGGITIANIDGSDVLRLQPPPGFLNCAPRWSPDGTKLVYQRRPDTDDGVGNLFVFDLDSERNVHITDLELKRAWWWLLFPSFNREGDRVLFHMPRSSSPTTTWDVWSVPVPATREQPKLELRNASFPMLNSFPGGDPFAIWFLEPSASDLAGRSIMTGHPCCAARETLVKASGSIWWPTMSPDGSRIAYQDGGSIHVLDLSSVVSSRVAIGGTAEWLDNDTLIVTP